MVNKTVFGLSKGSDTRVLTHKAGTQAMDVLIHQSEEGHMIERQSTSLFRGSMYASLSLGVAERSVGVSPEMLIV